MFSIGCDFLTQLIDAGIVAKYLGNQRAQKMLM